MSWWKKGINNKKIRYILPICPEAPWTDLHQIWRSRRDRRRNHRYQIFWWSVKGCLFCGGSKIVISHWQSQSPLTQGWRYRAARDTQNFVLANKQNKTKSMLIFSTVVFVYWDWLVNTLQHHTNYGAALCSESQTGIRLWWFSAVRPLNTLKLNH